MPNPYSPYVSGYRNPGPYAPYETPLDVASQLIAGLATQQPVKRKGIDDSGFTLTKPASKYELSDADLRALQERMNPRAVNSAEPSPSSDQTGNSEPMGALSNGKYFPGAPGPGPYNMGLLSMKKYFPSAPGFGPFALPEKKTGMGGGSAKAKGVEVKTPESVSDDSSLTNDELRQADKYINLKPIAALVDSWTGSRLSQGYEDPNEKAFTKEATIRKLVQDKAAYDAKKKMDIMKFIQDRQDHQESQALREMNYNLGVQRLGLMKENQNNQLKVALANLSKHGRRTDSNAIAKQAMNEEKVTNRINGWVEKQAAIAAANGDETFNPESLFNKKLDEIVNHSAKTGRSIYGATEDILGQ